VSSSPRVMRTNIYSNLVSYSTSMSRGAGGGGRKVFGTTLALAGVGAAGYAATDTGFKTALEDILPGSGTVKELTIGQPEPATSLTIGSEMISSIIGMIPTLNAEEDVVESEIVADTQLDSSSASGSNKSETEVSVNSADKSTESEVTKTPEEGTSEQSTKEAISTVEDSINEKELPTTGEPERETEPSETKSIEVTETTKDETVQPDSVQVDPEKHMSLKEPLGEATETAADQLVSDAENEQTLPEEPKQENYIEVSASESQVSEDSVGEAATPPEKIVVMPSVKEEEVSAEPGLPDLCRKMEDAVNAAVTEFDGFSAEVVNHINLMLKVMELNLTVKDEDAWTQMFQAAQSKSDKAKSVELKESEALLAITKVMDNIADCRKNDECSDNSELDKAEESANLMIYHLDQAKAKVEAVETEAVAMEKFRDIVEAGKEEFHKEMASIMPDVELGEKSGKLSEYELNMFITHAYKKVLFLQQEVAKQQTLEQAKLSKALEIQKREIETIAMQHKEEELGKQAREMKEDQDKKISKMRKEAEEQQSSHLKRQAAAHTDHVNDMLAIQKEEMNRRHEHQLEEKASDMKKAHTDTLTSLSASLSGLTTALEARSSSDGSSLAAQSLWLACNTLKNTVNVGNIDAATWDEKLKPLIEEVGQVKLVAGNGDEFTSAVLGSLSPVALERGVFTEDSLKEKFCKVERVARQVASIGEEGGSLLAFGLSYLQSLLMVDISKRAPTETLEKMDLSAISATDLINLARHNLDRGNLAQAVQLMSQLKGEPGRVATDWLDEARLTLETQQAVEALLVYSQANSCKYLPAI